jgi:VIT1/CCC1 family predicted Fe2+/Mn2+ transporter
MESLLSEFIYGGMDGIITTVAIIGGTMGAKMPYSYTFILGMSNIIADGFSMGISRYNSLTNVSKQANALVSPFFSGLYTFIFFVLLGLIPLLPFILPFILHNKIENKTIEYLFVLLSLCAFLIVGIVKGYYSNKLMYSILEVTIIGTIGAGLSYMVARYLDDRIKN